MSKEVARLEAALKRATAAASDATRRSLDGWRAAYQEQKRLEREVGRAKGEEVAAEIEWKPAWDVGAPLPHVVSSGGRTLLLYLARISDPAWDGTYVNVIDPASPSGEDLALVEFHGCYAHKFGGPNDEVFHGHPLANRGLVAYRAHAIERSRWIEEQRKINAVHAQYRAESWADMQHYLLAFHDDVFECIARGFSIKTMHTSMREALALMTKRLLE